MFPNSYSFNPGMGNLFTKLVLDPVTMTPMLTGGGNITVNPLGVPGNLLLTQFARKTKSGKKCLLIIFLRNVLINCS
jgi:hypothetical protein